MFRKIVSFGSAAALLAGSLLIGGGAQAGATKIDVSHDHISCDSVWGSIGFAPPITATGGGTTIKLKGTVGGCTDSDNGSVIINGGSFSGKLMGSGTGFGALLGQSAPTGTITIKWVADKTTPLVQTSSVVTLGAAPGSVCGGLYSPTAPITSSGQGLFQLGGGVNCPDAGHQTTPVSVTGAFTGNDSGAASETTAVTSQSVAVLGGETTTGIKSINIGLGNLAIG